MRDTTLDVECYDPIYHLQLIEEEGRIVDIKVGLTPVCRGFE